MDDVCSNQPAQVCVGPLKWTIICTFLWKQTYRPLSVGLVLLRKDHFQMDTASIWHGPSYQLIHKVGYKWCQLHCSKGILPSLLSVGTTVRAFSSFPALSFSSLVAWTSSSTSCLSRVLIVLQPGNLLQYFCPRIGG